MKTKILVTILTSSALFTSCKLAKENIVEGYSLTVDISEAEDNYQAVKNANVYLKKDTLAYVEIYDEISGLFSPEGNLSCQLPDKLAKKIRKTKNWVPNSLERNLKDVNTSAVKFNDQSIMDYLCIIDVNPTNGENYPIQPVLSQELDVSDFIDNGKSKFMYTLDCSGYLNAALTFSSNVSSTKLKTAASSSFKNSGSVMIVRAHLTPPIVQIIRYPNTLNQTSNREQLEFLLSTRKELKNDCAKTDVISATRKLDVLWVSNEGSSSFNGSASLNGGFSFSGASIEGGAGASINRSSSFANFDSYLLNDDFFELANPITVEELENKISSLFKSAKISNRPQVVDSKLMFSLSIPEELAGLTWTIKDNNDISVNSSYIKDKKEVEFKLGGSDFKDSVYLLTATFKGISLEYAIIL